MAAIQSGCKRHRAVLWKEAPRISWGKRPGPSMQIGVKAVRKAEIEYLLTDSRNVEHLVTI